MTKAELEDDIRKIKIIMASPLMEALDVYYEYSFNDIELTKINWIRENNFPCENPLGDKQKK